MRGMGIAERVQVQRAQEQVDRIASVKAWRREAQADLGAAALTAGGATRGKGEEVAA